MMLCSIPLYFGPVSYTHLLNGEKRWIKKNINDVKDKNRNKDNFFLSFQTILIDDFLVNSPNKFE